MNAADTDARARELAPRLSETQRLAMRRGCIPGPHGRVSTINALRKRGLIEAASWSFSLQEWSFRRTELGRAVVRVLASQEVDRG